MQGSLEKISSRQMGEGHHGAMKLRKQGLGKIEASTI